MSTTSYADLLAATKLEHMLAQDIPTHDSDGDPVDVRAAVATLIADPTVSTTFNARRRTVSIELQLDPQQTDDPDPEPDPGPTS